MGSTVSPTAHTALTGQQGSLCSSPPHLKVLVCPDIAPCGAVLGSEHLKMYTASGHLRLPCGTSQQACASLALPGTLPKSVATPVLTHEAAQPMPDVLP